MIPHKSDSNRWGLQRLRIVFAVKRRSQVGYAAGVKGSTRWSWFQKMGGVMEGRLQEFLLFWLG